MNIILNFPPEDNHQKSLKRISKTVYFQEKTSGFYQLSFLPQVTAFKGQNLVVRKICSLTPYDPYLALLNYLAEYTVGSVGVLPEHFHGLELENLLRIEKEQKYSIDMEKVKTFLKLKAQNLSKTIRENQLDGTIIKTINSDPEKKQIIKSAIEILKAELNQYLWGALDQLQTSEVDRKKYPTFQQHQPVRKSIPKPKPSKKKEPYQISPNELKSQYKFDMKAFLSKK